MERNYRTKAGEVDIIGNDGNTLVFVEVKHWTVFPRADLEYSINREKRRRIIRVSREYLAGHKEQEGKNVRYDVVFIGKSAKVEHYADVFMET